MRDELHEWFFHKFSEFRVGSHHVDGAVEGEHRSKFGNLKHLSHHSLPPEAGQPFVPDFRQKLLDIRVGDESFLLVLDGEFQPVQSLPFARLPILARRVEVQHNLELVAGPRVIQQ